jgi:hypothetical protein
MDPDERADLDESEKFHLFICFLRSRQLYDAYRKRMIESISKLPAEEWVSGAIKPCMCKKTFWRRVDAEWRRELDSWRKRVSGCVSAP